MGGSAQQPCGTGSVGCWEISDKSARGRLVVTISDADGTTRAANPKMMKQLQGDDVTKLMFQYAPENGDRAAARLDVTIHKKGSTEARKAGVPMVVLKSKGETR